MVSLRSGWSFRRRLGLCLGLGLVAAGALAQEVLTDMSAGPPSGRYAFSSSTPKNLPELLRGPGQGEAVNIVGHLFLPSEPASGKLGAVVLIHGSGGIYEAMLDYWPRRFNAAGLAVLSLDTFGPRGVKSTAEDQSQVPFSADTADAFSALRVLATHPRIDPKRIAVMGFSRGGITAWRSAVNRIAGAQKLPGELRFAAHVPVYAGGCVGIFRITPRAGVFSPAPMLWVHGDADDYTPIGPCQEYSEKIGQTGTPVTFLAIPGAHHKFDSDDTRKIAVRGAQRTTDDCPLETDVEAMAVLDRKTGQRLSGEALAAVQKSCAATGASVQGDKAARDKAADAITVFLGKALAPR
jgi:dienelactone hydrolase